MKTNALRLIMAGVATSVLLVGCGGHEKTHAVDKLEEAQAAALAKAPKAEAVKFADDGEEPMGGVGQNGKSATAAAAASATETKAEAMATAHHGEASASEATAEASASEPTSAAK